MVPALLCNEPRGDRLISIQAAFVRPDWTLIFVDHNVLMTFHVMCLRRQVLSASDVPIPGSAVCDNYISTSLNLIYLQVMATSMEPKAWSS